MANSKIILTFNTDLNIDQQIGFKVSNIGSSFFTDQMFVWKNIRQGFGQVTKGTPTGIVGERSAINFVQSYNLDWNNYGGGGVHYTVTRLGNVVTIESNFNNVIFSSFFSINNVNVFPGVSNTDVTSNIVNNTNGLFQVNSIAFSQANALPCQKIKVLIQTSQLAAKILQPIVNNSNTSNPIDLEVLRNSSFNLLLEDVSGQTIQKTYQTPPLLNISNFNIIINSSPIGGTVIINDTVNVNYPINLQLNYQYSLDNTNWQALNQFSGLVPGNYTIYIKDQYGCSVNETIIVSQFGIQSPYFYISKANSIRFANRITWGDSENYKTDENTLSCEADVEIAYKEVQQFQSADIVTTQFKSNYTNNDIYVIKNNGNIVNVPIVKKTNNIGNTDKRDARNFNLGNGKSGVYFVSGNTYDYYSNATIEAYSLNGLLPEWGKIGNYFEIGGFWYLIEDIIFYETKNADVLVYSNIYTGPETNIIVGSIFNRFNYEVYEFSVDMVNYIDEKFRIKIECTDPNFTTITHLSEEIWCKVKHHNVLEIKYYNSTNTDIMYSTGIEHKIRIPYLKISGKTDENSEAHKTDTDTILLNADLYEVDDFQFEPLTKELWRKLTIALSHEKVFINGVGYVKSGNFNTEGPLERSNLYVLTATMIKTGNVYNSQTSGNLDFNGNEVQVPGLVSTEIGYVSY